MYACLAVTCHLHFWQNDRDFLRATVVTRGWNGYRNKSQHRKSTLEKKILPPFQQGFEPATFQSRVRRSNHWAICPLDSSTNSALKQTPFGIPPWNLWNRGTQLSARYTNGPSVTEAQHQSQLVWIVQIWPGHFRLTADRFRGNSRIVMLWVACELLQFAAIQ